MGETVEWFFGRGLSIGCGLKWSVPPEWGVCERSDLVDRVKKAIAEEMKSAAVDTQDIRRFLELLARRTVAGWRHRFLTTNWDYLLQREMLALGLKEQPSWLANSHVFHLNGTVEVLHDNSRRSAIVLESDGGDARVATAEGEIAYNQFIWSRNFVVVGMSFECAVDKYLLSALQRVNQEVPIGESNWVVLNPDEGTLANACDAIQAALPDASVQGRRCTFGEWLDAGLPELRQSGALAA